ncbi:MAG: FAD-dependent oxidoreductase [Pseudomonadales bacterium]|nr:FAD-dependent oxidoreductase [Pseudomonadales bacterium]NRA17743.1 FAD-dependent oxidoreductase [Oceanospirillaceae bacterium]
MLKSYAFTQYPYCRSADQDAPHNVIHPVVIIGAGPMGLAAAVDFSIKGIPVVIIDDNNTVSVGSRAVCYAKRFLDISDRLGVGQRLIDKGVSWNLGKVFFEDQQIYSFDMRPEEHHRRPGFINLQQYYLEQYYVERLVDFPSASLRWKNKLVAISQDSERVSLEIETPEGRYQIEARYVIACDGANSKTRQLCSLESSGEVFADRFLIADIIMRDQSFPPERWFWFNPPFHDGSSTLLHRQPDNLWRIDFDLGWDADPEVEKRPENIIPRVKAFLGDEVEFELEWSSVYTFCCRRMQNFRHERIFFAGDAAHQVSPFGARGANSGIEDIDNLVWKIQLALTGFANQKLLDSYSEERILAADENILNSTRSTDFITPKNRANKVMRDAVLALAKEFSFARPLVNSGRLSVPPVLRSCSHISPDQQSFNSAVEPGSPCTDAPVLFKGNQSYLLSLVGNHFHCLLFIDDLETLSGSERDQLQALSELALPIHPYIITAKASEIELAAPINLLIDHLGLIAQRLDSSDRCCYLLRPDQLVAGRCRDFNFNLISQMQRRALGDFTDV